MKGHMYKSRKNLEVLTQNKGPKRILVSKSEIVFAYKKSHSSGMVFGQWLLTSFFYILFFFFLKS
jgi:hypothetical protein